VHNPTKIYFFIFRVIYINRSINPPEYEYKSIAIKGLSDYGSNWTEKFLYHLKNTQNTTSRINIIKILDKDKKMNVFKQLLPFVRDADPFVRSEIIKTFEKRFKQERMTEDFKKIMKDFISFEI